jgi:N-acyl-D-aspartate/D-glutamate deacylase
MSDLLVRGGKLIDGTGAPARRADVRIRDGRIAEVGPDLARDGSPELDAGGSVVAPGFIDGHTHHDPSLFWDPGCDPLPEHGVTTVVTGNCSLSLAPLRSGDREQLIDMFCFIEDLPAEAFERGVPFTWEGFDEYRASFDRMGAAVHQATLVGHSALRLYVMGEASFERVSTDEERSEIRNLFGRCLDAGSFGLSTSFADIDRNGRPVPSRAADDAELAALLSAMAERKRGVLEFVPTQHDEVQKRADIERVHRLSCQSGVPATWTQLVANARNADDVKQLLAQAERTQADGPGVYPQASPRPFDINLSFESTPLFMHQPSWHALVQARPDEKRRLLGDADWRRRAREEWDDRGPSMFPKDRPRQIVFTRAERPDQERWLDRNLHEISEARGVHPADALADLLADNDLDPGISMVDLSNEDPDRVAELVTHRAVLCAASDAGAHAQMMCGAGDTTLLMTRYARDRGDLTVEEAVRRLTSELAGFFGIPGRGVVAPDYAGDLAVFELDALVWPKTRFVDDLPGGGRRITRGPGRYAATVVDGVVTQADGVATGARPGRMLDPGARWSL